MTTREDVVSFVNDYLNISAVPDSSLNGLQVEGRDTVRKIAFGVSANLELFKKAKEAGADMIIVHHGLLWGKEQALTGAFGRRVAFLLQNQISLLGYHLPLDKHPIIGHNALFQIITFFQMFNFDQRCFLWHVFPHLSHIWQRSLFPIPRKIRIAPLSILPAVRWI